MSLARFKILVLVAMWFENESMRKKKWRPGGDELVLDMKRMKRKPPPVLIEDRTIVGPIDRGLNSTNDMPEVGGSRNR